MQHTPSFSLLFLVAGLIGSQNIASAQCGSDGEIPDRTALDSILGGNQTLEDFETFQIGSGAAVLLDTALLDDTSIANGQGPGLVQPGATYSDTSNLQLQWNGDLYFNISTATILASGSGGQIDIVYSPAVQAMGLDLAGFDNFSYKGTASIYDTGNALIGTINFAVVGGASRDFIGWQHMAGIARVELHSPDYGWSPIIDDHGYGDCSGGGGITKYCNPGDGHKNNTSGIDVSGNTLSQGPINVCLTGGPPSELGYLLIGSSNKIVVQPPGSMGDLCIVGGFIARYTKDIGAIDGAGSLCTDIQNSLTGGSNYGIPRGGGSIVGGSTWYFQYWHRQPGGQLSTFSEAAAVTFT